MIDTQPRAGKSYFEEKKIELDYVLLVPPIIFESAIKSVNAFQRTLSLWASARRVALLSFIFFSILVPSSIPSCGADASGASSFFFFFLD